MLRHVTITNVLVSSGGHPKAAMLDTMNMQCLERQGNAASENTYAILMHIIMPTDC